jgi:hypothetical protein
MGIIGIVGPEGQGQHVLDGDSFLHRITCQRDTTYNNIGGQYTNYVTRKYGHAIIVFDGYAPELSTKYSVHLSISQVTW